MLTELRTKSQITIPKDIVMKMGLREGDKLEIVEKDGVIELMPVAVYPKKYLDELRSEINEAKAKIAAGEQPVFDKKLEILEMDPLYPSLRTKRIQGTVDLFEFSVNMDVRVIWQYDGDTIILLLDIGHHDILNQF